MQNLLLLEKSSGISYRENSEGDRDVIQRSPGWSATFEKSYRVKLLSHKPDFHDKANLIDLSDVTDNFQE